MLNFSAAACARRTTPAPASKRYARPLTTTATDGPELAGSGIGVPEPNMITFAPSAGDAAGVIVRKPPKTIRIRESFDSGTECTFCVSVTGPGCRMFRGRPVLTIRISLRHLAYEPRWQRQEPLDSTRRLRRENESGATAN